MTSAVIVDVAGGPMGGAARFRIELYQYLERTGRKDVQVIGAKRSLDPAWLLRREAARPIRARRVALNNVGFVTPGGERWTLLGNALHFLTSAETATLHRSIRSLVMHQAAVVRLAARRSDVLVAPCSAMAERVSKALPSVRDRLVVRMHPVSPNMSTDRAPDSVILCPVIFESYKHMDMHLTNWVTVMDGGIDPSVQLLVTASAAEVPISVARNERIQLVGRLDHAELRRLWARSRAVYFPPGLESFGFPLAEARVSGIPAIAQDTRQNREIAGPALCGFSPGDANSLLNATKLAFSKHVTPDPAPFDPDRYFQWMLGSP
jgi:hypothetical protein